MAPNQTRRSVEFPAGPLHRGPSYPCNNLLKEEERLKTFEGWPHSFLRPEELAADGFFYTGEGDRVVCVFCSIDVHEWQPGDTAHGDHQKWSPQCPIVRRYPCGNIRAGDTKCESNAPHDCTMRAFCRLIRPYSGPERDDLSEHLDRYMALQEASKSKGPEYPHYESVDARKATFTNWPSESIAKSEDLAEAGFFYTGQDDETLCFYCGGGIKQWCVGDLPWDEHARWFSRCPFVLREKGLEFVVKVKADRRPIVTAREMNQIIRRSMAKRDTVSSGEDVGPSNAQSLMTGCVGGVDVGPSECVGAATSLPVCSSESSSRPNSINLYREEHRLKTFSSWPHSFLTPKELAADGFYYTGDSDNVRCAFCGIEVNGWEPGDVARDDHRKWSPECDMVLGVPCGNIRLPEQIPSGSDTCGPYDLITRPETGKRSVSELEALGVISIGGAVNPQYATLEARKRTFANWPKTSPVKPDDLAEAGFFYTGSLDRVKCFRCDGCLAEWKEGDEPWKEHARWYPRCLFVKMTKGMDFITQVLNECYPIPPPTSKTPAGSDGQTLVLPSTSEGESREPTVSASTREEKRLETFVDWPHSFVTPAELAAAGFYYTKERDLVRCAFCGIEVQGWVPGVSAAANHATYSPECDMVRGVPCGNIPKIRTHPLSVPSCVPFDVPRTASFRDLEELGVNRFVKPIIPTYATVEARRRTFANWPQSCPVRPQDLIDAGFYYTGNEDETICFHCAGGLKHWEVGDDPWTEHARWFAQCQYVIREKGRQFVNRAIQQRSAEIEEEAFYQLLNEASAVYNEPAVEATGGEATSTPAAGQVAAPVQAAAHNDDRTLREWELCTICYTRERSIVFLPCGHFMSCSSCASALSNCPVCRKQCQATVRAYLS